MRLAQCRATAAAFDTLRLASALVVEMRQIRSQCSRVSWRRPLPSAPSTSAKGRVSEVASSAWSPCSARPNSQRAALARVGQTLRQILDEDDRHEIGRAAAALASAPCRGGLCRSVITRPEAPNAAEERNAAPTFCGSVTWSSTSNKASGVDLVERNRRQRLNLGGNALMHRVETQQPVEIPGRRGFRREAALGKKGAQSVSGILGGDNPHHRPPGIGEGGLDRMKSIEWSELASLNSYVSGRPGRLRRTAASFVSFWVSRST